MVGLRGVYMKATDVFDLTYACFGRQIHPSSDGRIIKSPAKPVIYLGKSLLDFVRGSSFTCIEKNSWGSRYIFDRS